MRRRNFAQCRDCEIAPVLKLQSVKRYTEIAIGANDSQVADLERGQLRNSAACFGSVSFI